MISRLKKTNNFKNHEKINLFLQYYNYGMNLECEIGKELQFRLRFLITLCLIFGIFQRDMFSKFMRV